MAGGFVLENQLKVRAKVSSWNYGKHSTAPFACLTWLSWMLTFAYPFCQKQDSGLIIYNTGAHDKGSAYTWAFMRQMSEIKSLPMIFTGSVFLTSQNHNIIITQTGCWLGIWGIKKRKNCKEVHSHFVKPFAGTCAWECKITVIGNSVNKKGIGYSEDKPWMKLPASLLWIERKHLAWVFTTSFIS